MDERTKQIDLFFTHYAKVFNEALKGDPDIDDTVSSFADCFIEANPIGVKCGKNDSQFRKVIPQGYAFYKSIGITAMSILSKEITVLDEYHTMAKLHWKSDFTKKNKSTGSIEFDVIYFLQTKKNEHKIFAYITGNEQAALKENGLI